MLLFLLLQLRAGYGASDTIRLVTGLTPRGQSSGRRPCSEGFNYSDTRTSNDSARVLLPALPHVSTSCRCRVALAFAGGLWENCLLLKKRYVHKLVAQAALLLVLGQPCLARAGRHGQAVAHRSVRQGSFLNEERLYVLMLSSNGDSDHVIASPKPPFQTVHTDTYEFNQKHKSPRSRHSQLSYSA